MSERLTHDELSLPYLVPSEGEPRQVVSLDEDAPTGSPRKPWELMQRGLADQQRESRQTLSVDPQPD